MLNSHKNYFQLFDLPVDFALDVGVLAERYRALVRAVRADFLSDEEDETARSLARIDLAYQTLTEPLTRAEYLFQLYGVAAAESSRDEDPASTLLVEEMERQEALEAATNRSDPGAALSEVLTRLAERGAALDKELHQLFADPTPSNLRAARAVVGQLHILARYQRETEERQAEVLKGRAAGLNTSRTVD
ncbi:molecular chaperone HscB [Allochromatium warmingii]|uniref:Molecular chaperone HscB n=1 Tax=Allochromatium warmingii TaxID=61595 RepID=A0A1H3G2X0_ALLWA|nr:iron-sulfur cluster co-chaperone HscB C-terminal domain-containing protein [Allochromatium warmingii]SDX97682.1 molecular chaperone HscB [Allochromatium warmingii]